MSGESQTDVLSGKFRFKNIVMAKNKLVCSQLIAVMN